MYVNGFPDSSVGKESPSMQETLVQFLGQEDLLQKEQATHSQYSWASLVAQLVKKSTCNVRDLSSIPGLGRSPGERKGYPLQYSCLENSMDCIIHGVTKSWTQLSNFHFHFQCLYMEPRKMALINLFVGQQRKHRHKQTYGHRSGRRGWNALRE